MTGSRFEEACDFLFPRTTADREYSLEPTRKLLRALGNPEEEFPVIHIGGTNGKGSVGAMVASVLRHSGLKTGWYSSPHLTDVRERFRIDGTPISQSAFVSWFDRLKPAIEATQGTFFEATTAIALAHFAAGSVDVAVVEVGLGGRLDSTNVIPSVLSAVTNVGLDHTEYLGTTRQAIAKEKAGIAKPDTPFVIGETDPEIANILAEEARKLGADPLIVDPLGVFEGELKLTGAFQRRNAHIASQLLGCLEPNLRPEKPEILAGLAQAWLPGRWDRRGKWVFDVAHNAEGMRVVAQNIVGEDLPRPLNVVLGVLADKDLRGILDALRPVVDKIWLTVAPSAPQDRRRAPASLELERDSNVLVEPDFEKAVAAAVREAGSVLVTGSFHTVGDTMARLPGFQPLG